MEEQLVSFETAKLAKEKGFKLDHSYLYKWYNKEGKLGQWLYLQTNEDIEFLAPSQSLLQKWLREKHGIIVLPCINDNGDGDWWITYKIWSVKEKDYLYESYYSTAFNTHEEALEMGLKEGLKLINK